MESQGPWKHLPPLVRPSSQTHEVAPPYPPLWLAAAKPTLFSNEFSLADRVALVSGGNRGLGLEMALALVEAGARAVYCVDLPKQPGEEWTKVRDYAARMEGIAGEGRLEYVSADVRDQEAMWKVGETVGDREGRMDVCVAAAGVLKTHTDCLEYPRAQFQDVSVSVSSVVVWWLPALLRERSVLENVCMPTAA